MPDKSMKRCDIEMQYSEKILCLSGMTSDMSYFLLQILKAWMHLHKYYVEKRDQQLKVACSLLSHMLHQ